jgi:hypothetical protein
MLSYLFVRGGFDVLTGILELIARLNDNDLPISHRDTYPSRLRGVTSLLAPHVRRFSKSKYTTFILRQEG